MKKIFQVFVFLPLLLSAQIPPGYYNPAQGLTGNNLKVALHNIIKNHNQLTYAGLWSAFPKTDKKANGKVWDIYSTVPAGTPPYEYTFITNQCGNYNGEGDCYNREHSWPQSWFNATPGPDSDLFHIYPTDGKVNGVRSNYPYGNVSSASWTSLNGGKLGPCTNTGYNLTVFEPVNEFKGDLARGYFYMCTRYYSEDGGWSFSDAVNKATILPWQLNVLLQWHHQDPVSAKEVARNDSIYYKFQNNRNPFIDNPAWADSIWVSANSIFERESRLQHSFSLFPNPAAEHFFIINHGQPTEVEFTVTDVSGKVISVKKETLSEYLTIDCSSWNAGVYFLVIKNSVSVSRLKFIKT
ncbi:MAG: endonuclease [Bacteroidetes bacterium]|nr:endonuclease [Bacteroidota bacterium]